MATSTNLISGLVSGFDWRSIVDQLIAIDHRRVDLVEDKKTEYESQLAEWQNVNSMLLSLKTASAALSTESAFNVYTSGTTSNTATSASNVLSATTSSTASPGLYNIVVNNLAQSEKISSSNYTATNTALNLSGDIMVSGTAVNITITDTLSDIKDKINSVNTGTDPSNVTAGIVSHSSTNYHLVLTCDDTGEDGLSVLEGAYSGGDNILEEMGFISGSTTIKTATSDGAKSDLFASSSGAIKTLLGLSSAPGEITDIKVGGLDVSIDLSSDTESLTTIAQKIDALAGISAEVVSETVSGETKYRIDISGTTSFAESTTGNSNVLQTLGILQGTYGNTTEVHAGTVVIQNAADTALEGAPATLMTDLKIGGSSASVVNGDKITISGTKHDGTDATTTEFIVDTGNADHDCVDDLITHIQAAFGATVTASFSGGKLTITDGSSGESQLEVSMICDNAGGGTLNFGEVTMTTEGRSRQVVAGEDAEIVVDNVTITKSSNTINDVIAGATLNLVGEDSDTTVTLKVERDLATIKTKIEDMVSAYNTILNYINTQFTYDEDTKEVGGILFGDGMLSTIKSELINTVTSTVTGASSNYNKLALIGITLDVVDTDEGEYNKLNLVIDDDGSDDNDLTDYLETNFDDVRKLFIASGSSPYSTMTLVGHSDNTEGGTYDVTISAAATQSSFTGLTAIGGGGLSASDTLTITDWETDREATVSLTSGDSIDDVVNAINSEFAEEVTEVLQGSIDTGHTISTTFSSIDADSDNAVITFSGARQNGLTVSGSYTIGDSTTETLGDLLETIEDMFEDDVTATLDSNGKLIITGTQAGDSQLEFTIDTSAVDGLNLGSVTTTTEGRYTIPITASKTSEDKILFTHNTYGTGHGIVVSHTNTVDDPLGINGVSQVWGVNVDGTINGLDATCSGQILTLNSDGNNADGLSISYTGTSTIAVEDGATFTLTLGIGELMDRRLGFVTNSTDGYVTYKQTSLGNSIESLEDQISDMEARLNRKLEKLINEYVAMELALSNIQNQSDWLSSQISASWSAWG